MKYYSVVPNKYSMEESAQVVSFNADSMTEAIEIGRAILIELGQNPKEFHIQWEAETHE